MPRWVIGVLINCLGSIAINLGTNLMKLSHKKRGADKRPTVDLDALEYQQHEQAKLMQQDCASDDDGLVVDPSQLDTTDGLEMPRMHATGIALRSKTLPRVHASGVGVLHSNSSAHTANCMKTTTSESSSDLVAPDLVHQSGNSYSANGPMPASNGNKLQHMGGDSSIANTSVTMQLSVQQLKSCDIARKDISSGNTLMTVNSQSLWTKRTASSSVHSASSTTDSLAKKSSKDIRALWYTGASSLGAGSILNFISMGFAPQSLLASLGSVQFISNVVFGKVILKETVTIRIVLGTATIISGNIITVLFSPRQEANYNKADLVSFYDTDYQLLLLVELIVAISMHMVHAHYGRRREKGSVLPATDIIMPLAYATCSAIIGTQSVIQAKCLSELLNMTFRGDNQLVYPFTYAVTVLWLGTTVFWLVRMNKALQQFHGLFIIPALQVFWSFFSIVGGGVFFEEFQELSDADLGVFTVGVFIVFTGVYIMAPKSTTTSSLQQQSAASFSMYRHDNITSSRSSDIGDATTYGGSRTHIISNEYNNSDHNNNVTNRRHYDVLQDFSNPLKRHSNGKVSCRPAMQ
jgi:Magnesium transporter NIPA